MPPSRRGLGREESEQGNLNRQLTQRLHVQRQRLLDRLTHALNQQAEAFNGHLEARLAEFLAGTQQALQSALDKVNQDIARAQNAALQAALAQLDQGLAANRERILAEVNAMLEAPKLEQQENLAPMRGKLVKATTKRGAVQGIVTDVQTDYLELDYNMHLPYANIVFVSLV